MRVSHAEAGRPRENRYGGPWRSLIYIYVTGSLLEHAWFPWSFKRHTFHFFAIQNKLCNTREMSHCRGFSPTFAITLFVSLSLLRYFLLLPFFSNWLLSTSALCQQSGMCVRMIWLTILGMWASLPLFVLLIDTDRQWAWTRNSSYTYTGMFQFIMTRFCFSKRNFPIFTFLYCCKKSN